MNIEFELKFFAQHDAIRATLASLGAVCIRKMALMRRYVFYLSPESGHDRWLRVRDEGEFVSLTLKTYDASKEIDSAKELELQVSDFDGMVNLLKNLGHEVGSYVENYREIWSLGDCFVMLDRWPWLDEFVEVEGQSKESVFAVAALLKISKESFSYGPNRLLYEKKYGISSKVVNLNQRLTFEQRPDWAQSKL